MIPPARIVKISVGVLLILIIALFVARSCIHQKHAASENKAAVSEQVRKKVRWLPTTTPAGLRPISPEPTAPRIAIILDDWGNNLALVQDAMNVHRPLTLSILPHLLHSKEIAEEAFQNKLGVMLHMPMQPKSKKQILEPHTIMVTNSDQEITEYLDAALADIPHVEGVNNHMGSAATSDERVMRVFLSHLKKTGHFFIDSNTDGGSVAFKVARELNVPSAKREIFLDNQTDAPSIRNQILRAKKIAIARGQVVVIGHDKKVTLQVIKEMVPEIEKDGVELVFVRELLK